MESWAGLPETGPAGPGGLNDKIRLHVPELGDRARHKWAQVCCRVGMDDRTAIKVKNTFRCIDYVTLPSQSVQPS